MVLLTRLESESWSRDMNRKVRDFVSCLVKGWGVQDKIFSPAKNRNWLIFLVRLEYPEILPKMALNNKY